MRRTNAAAFIVSLIASISAMLVLRSDDANASSYRNFSAFGCASVWSSNYTYSTSADINNANGQVGNSSTAEPIMVVCPVNGDSQISTTASTATMTITGWYNGGTGACADSGTEDYTVKTCVAYYNGSGGGCGTAASGVSPGGAQSLDASASDWSDASTTDGFLVVATLGCIKGSNQNAIFSYILGN
jgi:hypothetical protein